MLQKKQKKKLPVPGIFFLKPLRCDVSTNNLD